MSNDVDMETDNLPPGRVTDLHVENLDDMVAVHFTAPGDDLDSDDKADKYNVKFSSTVGNLTGGNFDKDEFNTVITDKDLVNDSTLEPENGGTQKTFFIKDSLFTVGEKYVLALKAVDEKQNQGQVSNVAQIFLPAPTTPTSKPSTTHPVPDCPPGWLNAHADGCFTFLGEHTGLSWIDADSACEQVNGRSGSPLIKNCGKHLKMTFPSGRWLSSRTPIQNPNGTHKRLSLRGLGYGSTQTRDWCNLSLP